ncbi:MULTISPECIES: class I SAM-dependent methyltransferase [unclassified Microcoleus]|uniref:class I SAM-dependent methyltransferase n=1 Tax=unclassified Microcoleus TaxID=2642155 RepID=UPI00403F62F0
MATLFRDLSYRYQCLYDAIARLAALSVGGDARLGQVAVQNLTVSAETKVLDRCCGSGQTRQFLLQYSQDVTGLDASPRSLELAWKNVLSANYVEAFANSMPFPDCQFDRSTQQRCDARNAIGAIATNLSGSILRVRARLCIHFGRFSSAYKSGISARVGCIFVVI